MQAEDAVFPSEERFFMAKKLSRNGVYSPHLAGPRSHPHVNLFPVRGGDLQDSALGDDPPPGKVLVGGVLDQVDDLAQHALAADDHVCVVGCYELDLASPALGANGLLLLLAYAGFSRLPTGVVLPLLPQLGDSTVVHGLSKLD